MTAGITAAGVAAAASVATAAYTIMQSSKDVGGAALAPPVLDKPTTIPTPASGDKAKRASIAEQLRRRGRASTILTDLTADTLG
jgi:hypothetical protein